MAGFSFQKRHGSNFKHDYNRHRIRKPIICFLPVCSKHTLVGNRNSENTKTKLINSFSSKHTHKKTKGLLKGVQNIKTENPILIGYKKTMYSR